MYWPLACNHRVPHSLFCSIFFCKHAAIGLFRAVSIFRRNRFMLKSGYSRHLLLFASLFLSGSIALLHPASAFAQLTSGDIVGTVTDPSGAGVPHATVTATNNSTGVANYRTGERPRRVPFPEPADWQIRDQGYGAWVSGLQPSGFRRYPESDGDRATAAASGSCIHQRGSLRAGCRRSGHHDGPVAADL